MSDLQDLYQEMILDHSRRPRNRGSLTDATSHADGHNPLCGDRVTVYLDLDGGRVVDVTFEGSGCAISTASASLMTEAIKGRSVDEVRAAFERFHRVLTGSTTNSDTADLGKLAVFSGVGRFPARVKCATLAWHTLIAALDRRPDPITTE